MASRARTWAAIQSGRLCVHLCFTPFAGEPVDDDRHRVARVIHEQLLPGGVGLAHDHRQLGCEGPVQRAEARIAQAIRLLGDVLLPQDRQGDMLALQFAMNGGPVRLRPPRRPGLGAAFAVKPLFKLAVAEPLRQRPAQTRGVESVARTVDGALPVRRAISRTDSFSTVINRKISRTWRIAILSAGIGSLLERIKERTLNEPAEASGAPFQNRVKPPQQVG